MTRRIDTVRTAKRPNTGTRNITPTAVFIRSPILITMAQSTSDSSVTGREGAEKKNSVPYVEVMVITVFGEDVIDLNCSVLICPSYSSGWLAVQHQSLGIERFTPFLNLVIAEPGMIKRKFISYINSYYHNRICKIYYYQNKWKSAVFLLFCKYFKHKKHNCILFGICTLFISANFSLPGISNVTVKL